MTSFIPLFFFLHSLFLSFRYDQTDREFKSERFNSMQVNDVVVIRQNNRAGHHDVTGKRSHLHNKEATVLGTAVWPNTWLSLRVNETQEVVKVRTSNIILLADWKRMLATGNTAVLISPLPAKKAAPKPLKTTGGVSGDAARVAKRAADGKKRAALTALGVDTDDAIGGGYGSADDAVRILLRTISLSLSPSLPLSPSLSLLKNLQRRSFTLND